MGSHQRPFRISVYDRTDPRSGRNHLHPLVSLLVTDVGQGVVRTLHDVPHQGLYRDELGDIGFRTGIGKVVHTVAGDEVIAADPGAILEAENEIVRGEKAVLLLLQERVVGEVDILESRYLFRRQVDLLLSGWLEALKGFLALHFIAVQPELERDIHKLLEVLDVGGHRVRPQTVAAEPLDKVQVHGDRDVVEEYCFLVTIGRESLDLPRKGWVRSVRLVADRMQARFALFVVLPDESGKGLRTAQQVLTSDPVDQALQLCVDLGGQRNAAHYPTRFVVPLLGQHVVIGPPVLFSVGGVDVYLDVAGTVFTFPLLPQNRANRHDVRNLNLVRNMLENQVQNRQLRAKTNNFTP